MCGNWKDCEPEPFDTVWQTQEEMVQEGVEWGTNEMKRVCHDRHGMLVNANFMDLAARKIGLKELWIIKWHKGCSKILSENRVVKGGPFLRRGPFFLRAF
jgi:hypothetical protein